MNVYGVLVVYNPAPGQLELAVERLSNQVDFVVIGNNSSSEITLDTENVKVFNFFENKGIAFAQSKCMEWAFDNGAEAVIQVDQDSVLAHNTVQNLIASYFELSSQGLNVGMIGPRIYDKVTNEVDVAKLHKGEIIKGSSCSTVKLMISSSCIIFRDAYKKVGGMDDSLFIDFVDFEYCWRLVKNDFLIVRDNNIFLAHRVGNGKRKVLGINLQFPAAQRHYYKARNTLLLFRRSYIPLSWKMISLSKIILTIPLYFLFFEDGFKRVKYTTKGLVDGLLGISGKGLFKV